MQQDTEIGRDLAECMCEIVCVCVCICLSNYTLMNKALHRGGVPHSSGFRPEEQTATASLLRLAGTVQNTNVEEEAERGKDRRGRVMKGVEKEEDEH